jgi:hypothetical protein
MNRGWIPLLLAVLGAAIFLVWNMFGVAEYNASVLGRLSADALVGGLLGGLIGRFIIRQR